MAGTERYISDGFPDADDALERRLNNNPRANESAAKETGRLLIEELMGGSSVFETTDISVGEPLSYKKYPDPTGAPYGEGFDYREVEL